VFARLVDRAWRLAGTGFAFAFIFAGGALAAATVFPVIGWRSADRADRSRRTQSAIRSILRFYVAMLQRLGLLRLEVVGADALASARSCMVVANHPTLLDALLLMALVPRLQCIVKHQLWQNPFLGRVVRSAGYISNDLEAGAMIAACRTSMSSGGNLVIFPEGTRTRPGEAMRMHQGFAYIALLADVDIQLVTITCEPLTLTKGERWWHIPARPPLFRVVAGERLRMRELLSVDSRSQAAQKIIRRVERHFAEQQVHG
jgi:1-acyl-sn-glycerol-3-phosphate acyltransferase